MSTNGENPSAMKSRLYRGTLFHTRRSPKRHSFSYRVFMPFVHLQSLPALVDDIPFWSARRFAPARFKREDFLGDPNKPLIDEVRRRIREETGNEHDGPIYLLANWRYFGFQINPIACYFCYDPSGDRLQYLVAEVTNTPWDERHSYVLTAPPSGDTLSAEFDKAMHVSPFNPMNMVYRWRSSAPGDSLTIRLTNLQRSSQAPSETRGDALRIFDATLNLQAEPFTANALRRAILGFPFMTLKVFTGIYWQALLLLLKGVPIHAHPNRG